MILNNKIIEYNGVYWHDNAKDEIRYDVLKKMGYDVLVVTSDEYNRNKKPIKIIDNCIKFLTCK
jgi:very-short-patch-repair endonuclease